MDTIMIWCYHDGMKKSDPSLMEIARHGTPADLASALAAGTDLPAVHDVLWHQVITLGHMPMIQVLWEADTDARKNGVMILRLAAIHGHGDMVRMLLAAGVNGNDSEAICWAVTNGHTEVVEILMAAGADVHASCQGALSLAAANARAEITHRLIAAGADLHAHNDDALRMAATLGYTKVAEILLHAGADPVAAWSATPSSCQSLMIETLDACAGAMTATQCEVLALVSKGCARIAALASAARQARPLRR